MDFSLVDIIKYLYKWKLVIIVSAIVFFLLGSVFVKLKQTYNTKVIIQYKDSCISEGKFPDGADFDVNEIKSPNVVLNVLNDMGYDKIPDEERDQSLDTVRSCISISPVTPQYEIDFKEAKMKLGDEYEYYPNTFIVEYHGGSSALQTQNTLNSIVRNYFDYYAEKYLTLATLNEIDYSMNEKNFDYIEQLETIQDNIDETAKKLGTYTGESDSYRSPSSGLTFEDITKEFHQISEYTLPSIYAKLYEGQVTMDKALLIQKYNDRKEKLIQEAEDNEYLALQTNDKMDAYIEANVDVPNSYNSDNDKSGNSVSRSDDSGIVIINDIEINSDYRVKSKTTYDSLISAYASYLTQASTNRIEAERCDEIISKFTSEQNSDVDYAQCELSVKTEIDNTLERLQDLYKKANMVINDYNTYLLTLHIQKLSGIACEATVNGTLYKAAAALIAIIFSSLFVLVYEIVQYYKELEASGEFNNKLGRTKKKQPAKKSAAKPDPPEDSSKDEQKELQPV